MFDAIPIVILGGLLAASAHFIVEPFYTWLRETKLNLPPPSEGRTPRWLTGICERVFFCLAVAAGAEDWLTGMMAWLAVKLAANWQARSDITDHRERTNRAFSALLTGLVSMFFAGVAGFIIRWWVWVS